MEITLAAIEFVDTALNTPARERPEPAGVLSADKLTGILWKCAAKAFVTTFVALILGEIALDMVSGIWKDMTPTVPAGLSGVTHSLEKIPAAGPGWRSWLKEYRFALCFGAVFPVMAYTRLARYSRRRENRRVAVRIRHASAWISEHWFGLIVGNAFGAMASAFVLTIIQNFSLTQIVYRTLADVLRPVIHNSAVLFLGSSLFDTLNGLVAWYGDNQFKFTFWLLYIAAMGDDLGLPNIKTLGRFLWHRIQRALNPGQIGSGSNPA